MGPTAQRTSKSPTIRRILREAAEMSSSPSSEYTAEPLESDLFEWHFTLCGPPSSAYSDGVYHGRIILPNTYPLRPPNFRFTTPNGRFEVNREICLSISGHHEETWQPAWGIRTAIVALRSFMETDAKGQLGGLDSPEATRRLLASQSRSFTCPMCSKSNEEIIKESAERADELGSTTQQVEPPAELRFEWKDEIEKDSQKDLGRERRGSGGEGETAELAEGFVQTSQDTAVSTDTGTIRSRPSTRTNATTSQTQTVQPMNRAQPDSISPWIDRAIVILSILLLVLLCKVMFST